jgi:septal ring factor EnvC (AmiA/AmiB activator)
MATKKNEERATKRREKAIELLDKFESKSKSVQRKIKTIDLNLAKTEKKINSLIEELEIVQKERMEHKTQLKAISKTIKEYSKLVCKEFNVKESNISTIRKCDIRNR